jgi:hypothetical protein
VGPPFLCEVQILFALGKNQRGEKALYGGGAFRVNELDGPIGRIAADKLVHDFEDFLRFEVIDTNGAADIVEVNLAAAFSGLAKGVVNVQLVLFHGIFLLLCGCLSLTMSTLYNASGVM